MAFPVPSVVHALAIVRALADARALTLSEVAQRCAISPSSCLGLLRTLVAEGVLRVDAGKRYALLAPWSTIAAEEAEGSARLIARARPLIERAARAWQAPIGLWQVVSRDRFQLVALGEDASATRIHMEEGQRQPIGGGSVGRAFAAAQRVDAAELSRRHGDVRWQRPVSLAEYRAQIEQAAVRGYAIDDGLAFAGITSIAVALAGDPVRFCLTASIFAGSRRDEEVAALAAALTELAAALADRSTDPARRATA